MRKSLVFAALALTLASSTVYAAGALHPLDHCRIVNYQPSGGLTLGATLTFSACLTDSSSQGGQSIACGVPSSPAPAAILARVVAVNSTGAGAFRAWPTGGSEPSISVVLNYFKVADVGTPQYTPAPGDLALIKLGVGGNACLFNIEPYYTSPGGVVVDVEGYVD